MHAHDTQSRHLAIGLAGLAGFTDALGFLSLGGFFVSFMSGNSTRFAVGLSEKISWSFALVPFGIILLFVCGVMLGRFVRSYCASRPATAILCFMATLLMVAALASEAGLAIIAAPLMAVAMGAANNVFVRDGEVAVGVTYMTGTLVKFGQRLAGQLMGEPDHDWMPYLLLWVGLAGGAVIGALCYHWWGLHATWIAAAFCGILAFRAAKSERVRQ